MRADEFEQWLAADIFVCPLHGELPNPDQWDEGYCARCGEELMCGKQIPEEEGCTS